MNLDLALRHFNLSPPTTSGEGKYEEKLTDWFLEGRSSTTSCSATGPARVGAATFAQSKAQTGDRDGTGWATKNIGVALKQVCYGEWMLRERLVPHVRSDNWVLGVDDN